MSRLGSLSATAVKEFLSADSGDAAAALVTFTGPGVGTAVRICDKYTQRIAALTTDDEVIYGIVSRSTNFVYLPFKLSLPDDQAGSVPRGQIVMYDVTRYLMPTLRTITSYPTVLIELVMMSTPDTVEISMPAFQMGAITYDRDTISAELTVQNLSGEPFPSGTFTPSWFPGMF